MKKMITVLTAVLLIASLSLTAFAEASDDFIEKCRANHTEVFFDSEVSDEYSAVTATGFDALWEDRTLITEEDIQRAETYNNEESDSDTIRYDEMQYGLKLRMVYFVPYQMPTVSWDGTKEEKQWISSSKINNLDASLTALCTDQNIEASMEIAQRDEFWYVVSIEKFDVFEVYGDEQNDGWYKEELSAAACDSQISYEITFPVPSKYSACTELKLAKIDKGQISYMEDIDSDENTFTIKTNGSAAYVFVGNTADDTHDGTEASAAVVTAAPDDIQAGQVTNPADHNANANGTVTAPKTADASSIVWLLIAAAAAGICILLCSKRRHEC